MMGIRSCAGADLIDLIVVCLAAVNLTWVSSTSVAKSSRSAHTNLHKPFPDPVAREIARGRACRVSQSSDWSDLKSESASGTASSKGTAPLPSHERERS
jgi:hypothetical protein